jgi:hypothetical protein
MDSNTLAMLIVLPLIGLMVLALGGGLVLIVRDTVRRRGNWGVNTKPVFCPQCGESAPVVRAPKNWQQALWGGCTCARCGLEYDKWGRALDEQERLRRQGEFVDDPDSQPPPRNADWNEDSKTTR